MKYSEFINNFQYCGNGVGKDTSINDINKNELLVGIAVEFEHTNDINTSTSIAIDHLSENNQYYTELVNDGLVDEEKAIYLAKKFLNISKNNNSEKEQENEILGYKPLNVGDNIDEAFSEEMLSQEPYLTVKNELVKKYINNGHFDEPTANEKAINKIKQYNDWISVGSKRWNGSELADKLYQHDLKILGIQKNTPKQNLQAKHNTMQDFYNKAISNPVFKEIISVLKSKLASFNLSADEINNKISDIFSKNYTNIATALMKRQPVNIIANNLLSQTQQAQAAE
jgi:hypothetical protein